MFTRYIGTETNNNIIISNMKLYVTIAKVAGKINWPNLVVTFK